MDQQDIRVVYNEEFPVCRFEIDHYRKIAARDGLPLRFDGLSADLPAGLTPDAAARRLHVMHQGQILSGIPAFVVLWRVLPRYRLLARIVSLPLVRHVATLAYDHIAAPLLYRAHLRRVSRRS